MQFRRQNLLHFGHRKTSPVFLSAALALLASSCNPILSQRPNSNAVVPVRTAFAAAQEGQNAKIATGWLATLRDPALSRVVKTALANNPDLRATAARLKAAREGTIIGRAARLPDISANTNASRSRFNNVSSDSYSLTLNASWEPDIWGQLRDLDEASVADYESAVADFRSARLSLAVNTAQSWCNLVTAENQLTLARETLISFQQNYQIIQRGYKLGTLRPLDDAFGRSNVAEAQGSLESARLNRDEAARSLQILMGSYPDSLVDSSSELPEIPAIRAGLPSELLERRPDLTSRRIQIFASAKRADASRKNLLPNFVLTSNSGTSSGELRNLLDLNQLTTSISASIAQRLYSGGALSAQARQSLADNENEILLYQSDVLQAFQEVESALDTDESLRKQELYLLTDVENTALAERWAESNFIEGLDVGDRPSILEVLEGQRRALNARASLIALRNAQIQNYLDLLLALGGSI